ncbi:unnamed protein product [Durusdinium trenchii]|uniref:S phase cyclin A-associated protein in the endoplasmic reticulum N-terminal domain-containing protein n=1 Tax=Durusdinium trenchii TaxID=1381693 RepID=A0ABP0I3R5_9DINO
MKKAEDGKEGPVSRGAKGRESKASARPTSARVSASTETLAQTSPARGVAGSSGDRFLTREATSARRKESFASASSKRRGEASAPSTQPTPNSPPRKKQEDKEASSPPTVQPQVNLASVGPGAPLFAPPPGLERQSEEILAPPGLGPPPGLGGPMLGFSDLFASIRRRDFAEAYGGFETDTTSFDEEVELLRCEKDLVEAAVELGTTTSAEDDLLTTDADVDDEEDGLVSIAKFRPLLHRPSVANAVIEEEDEEDASENDPVPGSFEADSTQVRSRLWAQSLLRLRRSIDEIYLLCEFESDEGLTEQVQKILKQAGQDFGSLLKQLDNQQEYALMQGEYPFKTGVAWTTRPCKGGESMAEHIEKVQGSPVSASRVNAKETKRTSSREGRRRGAWLEEFEGDSLSDVTQLSTSLEERPDAKEDQSLGRDQGEKGNKDRSSQLYFMVQSTLENVHKRLGSSSKPSPEEVQQRHEARQRQAQARRAVQDEERQLQLRQAESRATAARERRQEQEMRRQRDLLEKMTRARRQYQDQLRVICQRAHKENRKAHEVAFLAKEALKSECEALKKKQENARVSRKLLREQMQQKLIESAARVAKVSEKRKQQLETWQEKVQQELEEKERLASERRRERMNSIKLKSQGHETRSEIVQRKRRELQEVDERTTQEFLRFRNKNIGKMALDCDGLPEAVREDLDAQTTKPRRKAATPTPTRGGRSSDSPLACSEPAIVETVDFEEDTSPRQVPKFSAKRAALRQELMAVALSDEEALRMACESDLRNATQNAAQRAKINKLAGDLAKLLKTTAACSEDAHPGFLNLEKTEAVLSEFCKVLTQVQREADLALILKLNCARMVVDICCYIKDSIRCLELSGDKAPLVAWKLNCNVMLCALKWLGLLCKSRLARLVLLLTGRVVLLADVATAYLEMHFADALKPQELEGGPVLFLPQLLHVLALHMKQAPPEGAPRELQGTLAAYLLLGLAEKLRELFRRAEIRGLNCFEGASPLPLLLLRAMCFLGTLVCAYRAPKADDTHKQVLEMFHDTELFGVVGILVSILLSEGRREKGAKLPQTVISLCVQAVRICNSIARIDLVTVQKTLGASRQQEFYHLLVSLLDYCVARLPASMAKPTGQAEESDLLHEAVVLLGFYCLQEPENQSILCYGEGQALLTRLAALPLHYFMDERGKAILFPTILASCFKSEQNLAVLRSEMNLSLVCTFLAAQMAQGEEVPPATPEGLPAFTCRFPPELWKEALAFFDGTSEAEAEADSAKATEA